jgi:ADP-heptose:LPS heptosyltransferase
MTRSVLVVRQDNAGDVLLAGPAVRAVAAGDARVTILCGPRGRDAAELLPAVSDVIAWRADWIDHEPEPIARGRIEALVRQIAARGFAQALILTSLHQSPLPLALLLRMAGVPQIAAISEDYPGSLLDVRVNVKREVHEVRRALAVAESCGYTLPNDDDRALRIERPAGLQAAASARRPYVVVHPGASASARAWSARRNRELVSLLARSGRNVVVTGCAGERELTASVSRGANSEQVADLGGATNLAELAEVIAAADAVVVGNSGPAHLAAAVGTPVVSVYAPTVPSARWHPWRVPFELLQRDVPCAGCRARDCPVPGHPCVESVTAGEAMEALARLSPRPDAVPA